MAKYWFPETEQAVIEYNSTDDPELRNRIYEEKLHAPCQKMVECIFNTFKFQYAQGNAKHLALAHLVSQLDMFKPEKGSGKSFGYFSFAVKNFFIFINTADYEIQQREIPLLNEEEEDEYNKIGQVLTYEDAPVETELSEIDFKGFGEYWRQNYGVKYCLKLHNPEARMIAMAIGELFKDCPEDILSTFKGKFSRCGKKSHVCHIARMTGLPSYMILNKVKVIGPEIKSAFQDFLNSDQQVNLPEIDRTLVASICKSAKEGVTQKHNALLHGVSINQVKQIVNGYTFKQLTPENWVWRDKPFTPKGEGNPNAKLTRDKVDQLRHDYLSGMKICDIARKYDVVWKTAKRVISGEIWGMPSLLPTSAEVPSIQPSNSLSQPVTS